MSRSRKYHTNASDGRETYYLSRCPASSVSSSPKKKKTGRKFDLRQNAYMMAHVCCLQTAYFTANLSLSCQQSP